MAAADAASSQLRGLGRGHILIAVAKDDERGMAADVETEAVLLRGTGEQLVSFISVK